MASRSALRQKRTRLAPARGKCSKALGRAASKLPKLMNLTGARWSTAGSVCTCGSFLRSHRHCLFVSLWQFTCCTTKRFPSISSGWLLALFFFASTRFCCHPEWQERNSPLYRLKYRRLVAWVGYDWFLTWQWGLYGALVALSVNQSIVFFATTRSMSRHHLV